MNSTIHETVYDSNFAPDLVSYQHEIDNNLTNNITFCNHSAEADTNKSNHSYLLKEFDDSNNDGLSIVSSSIA